MSLYINKIFSYIPNNVEFIDEIRKKNIWNIRFILYNGKKQKLNNKKAVAYFELKGILKEKEEKIKSIELEYSQEIKKYSKIIKGVKNEKT